MLYTLCIVLILIASVLIVLAVLVQSPKSGMAANFGASNQVMGVRQTADFLEKFTWGMAVAILVLSLMATLAMDSHLVSESNSSAAKDAGVLIEKMTVNEPVMPQAEIPAVEPEAPAAETPAQE
jgi:preprotein translocase, secG subunit